MGENVKHTPAKWADIKGYIVVKGGHTIASVNSYNTSEGKANARLISAAPELIDLVREMIPFLEDIARQRHPSWRPEMADRDSVLGRAYSAIAKVEGRP